MAGEVAEVGWAGRQESAAAERCGKLRPRTLLPRGSVRAREVTQSCRAFLPRQRLGRFWLAGFVLPASRGRVLGARNATGVSVGTFPSRSVCVLLARTPAPCCLRRVLPFSSDTPRCAEENWRVEESSFDVEGDIPGLEPYPGPRALQPVPCHVGATCRV